MPTGGVALKWGLGKVPMIADVQFLPPTCPECSGPMRLVSIVCSRAHILHPPVQTFECAACERDAIFQGQPTPMDRTRGNARLSFIAICHVRKACRSKSPGFEPIAAVLRQPLAALISEV